jgi:hypothetical protein
MNKLLIGFIIIQIIILIIVFIEYSKYIIYGHNKPKLIKEMFILLWVLISITALINIGYKLCINQL